MKTSEAINEISAALAKAQGEISNPHKDKENPAFKRGDKVSTYADLASGINAIREPLAKNGIAFIQTERMDGELLMVDTRLTHASGQWIEGEYPVCRFPARPQEVLACLTYARRGSLFALVGIAGDDDDGNETNKQEIPAKRIPTPPKPPSSAFEQEMSQVMRDDIIEAINDASSLQDLKECIDKNKTNFGRLQRADFESVKDAIDDRETALKGKIAAE
jgi:hypothetical protein